MSIVKLLTQAEALVLIDKIGSTAEVLQEEIHQAACSVFNHAFLHGDWTGVCRLLDKLPNGIRVKAVQHWFTYFSNGALALSQDKASGAWKVNKDRFARRSDLVPDLTIALNKAMAKNFADLVPEKGHETLDLKGFLKSLKRAATQRECFPGTTIPKVSQQVNSVASELVKAVEAMIAAQNAAKPSIDVVKAIKDAQVGIPGVTSRAA
jgi:hypothetical protein